MINFENSSAGRSSADTNGGYRGAATGNGSHTFDLQSFLVDFVVEATGYPPEIVDLDADLEADLGIDSIKKAQMFGEIGEHLKIPVDENLSLDDFPTLRHVFTYIHREAGSSVSSPSEDVSTVSTASPQATRLMAAEPVAASDISSPEMPAFNLETFLVDFVVEATGYPPEIVDLDADLEADLGIDSIKKAQLFGEIGEHLRIPVDENLSLDDFPTLRHVLAYIQHITSPAVTAALPSSSASLAPQIVAPAPRDFVMPAAAEPQRPAFDLEAFLVDFVVEATGYPPEIVDVDADLEADLGIDSIKKAQMFGEIGEHLQIPVDESLSLDDFPTLRHVLVYINDLTGAAFSAPATGQSPAVAKSQTIEAPPAAPIEGLKPLPTEADRVTSRFRLRMVDAPLSVSSATEPEFFGPAIILGEGPTAAALKSRLRQRGVTVHELSPRGSVEEAVAGLDRLCSGRPHPHLFVIDQQQGGDFDPFAELPKESLLLAYRVCQRWHQLVTDMAPPQRPTLAGVVSMGGDFGLGGRISSPLSGGICGLFKAIDVESMGKLLVKVVDAPRQEPADAVAAALLRELAAGQSDVEVALVQGRRRVIRALRQPGTSGHSRSIPQGSVWVVSGGGRGVTALVARELGRRFNLKLHLLGTSPLEQIDPAWRDLSPEQTKQLKAQIAMQARAANQSPPEAWTKIEKAIEIDQTLRALTAAGVQATYHTCDVADRRQLGDVLRRVRQTDGPIHGIIHGAGLEAACKFSKKKPETVRRAVSTKVDGAAALMALTRDDPLQFFVAFGSTSGRFGGLGQTDYSMANEMLCKLVGRFGSLRPDCAALAFHWTAWDEVGMAARPESRFALEAMNLKFMPPLEGVAHMIDLLQAQATDMEWLIIDHPSRLYSKHPVMSCTDGDPHLENGSHIVNGSHTAQQPLRARADSKPQDAAVGDAAGLSPALLLHRLAASVEPPAHECFVGLSQIVFADHEASGTVDFAPAPPRLERSALSPPVGDWVSARFPAATLATFYGRSLDVCRQWMFQRDGGRAQLEIPRGDAVPGAGEVPVDIVQACIAACAAYSYYMLDGRCELPRQIDLFRVARQIHAGERCTLRFYYRESGPAGNRYDLVLYGSDGSVILTIDGLHMDLAPVKT